MNIDLEAENKELKRQLAEKESIIKSNSKDAQKKLLQVHKNYYLREVIKGYTTTFDETTQDGKEAIISAILDEALANSNAELYLDDNDNLKLRNIDGTGVISPNHKQLDPGSFLELALTDNKVITGKNDPQGGTTKQPETPAKYSQLREEIKKSQASFAAASSFNPLNGD